MPPVKRYRIRTCSCLIITIALGACSQSVGSPAPSTKPEATTGSPPEASALPLAQGESLARSGDAEAPGP